MTPVRRRVSLLEFDAAPEGFVPLSAFIKTHFQDSGRSELAGIRVRKAGDRLERDGTPTPAYLRMLKGLSQAQLAEIIGSSQPSIARLEAGLERPSFEKLIKLNEALKVPFEDLIEAISNVPFDK